MDKFVDKSLLQHVDLYQPLVAAKVGAPPLMIRAITTPKKTEMVEGVQASAKRVDTYVLLSVLPDELRERVKLAIQALIAAG